MTSNAKKISIITVFFLIIFILIDLLLAAIIISPSKVTFRTPHPYYHHGLLPNKKAVAGWYNRRYPLYTNSLAFRDSKVREVSFNTNKRRVLFMGDSHTEGVGLKFEDTFTGQVIANIDTSRTEIFNAAAVSYSPRVYYLKTRYIIEEIGLIPDEVFVFIDISDLQNEIVYQKFEPRKIKGMEKVFFNLKNKIINHSFTINTLSGLSQNMKTRRFLKKSENFDEYRQDENHTDALELYASFFSGFDDKTLLSNPQFHGVGEWMYDEEFSKLAKAGLELGAENMEKLARLCEKHDIKLNIAVHPWKIQIARKEASNMMVDFWRNFAEEHQTGFISFYPLFLNPPFSAAMGLDFFIPNDNHWNKNGHYLVASELIKYIEKEHMDNRE